MPTISTFQLLVSRTDKSKTKRIYIAPITDVEEEKIENAKNVVLTYPNVKFVIKPKDVIFYGNISFDDKSEDYAILKDLTWFNHLKFGVKLPSNYDFKNHTCRVTDIIKYYDSYTPIDIIKFKYATLGKPKKCIIFEQNK